MDDLFRQLRTYLIPMWQRRWIGALVAWVVALLGASLVYVMQDKYEASARVYVDTQTVLKPLMTGLAFQPDSDQQVRMLARTLINRPNIERLIASPRIGLTGLSDVDRERTVDRLVKEIKIAPSGDANLFAITYKDINQTRAQRVVEDLVQMFVTSGVVDKRRDSEQARQFLDSQIKDYEEKLTVAENRLKDFKIKNFGLTGTSNQDYFARMSTATEESQRLRIELQAAERSRDALRKELSNEEPSMPVEALVPGAVSPQSETETRLDGLRRQLDDLLRRYTDQHPDVVAIKRSIAQLEAQRAEEELRRKSGKEKVAPTSPVFQKIRIALAEAEAKVAALRGQLSAQQAQMDQARSMASKMPEVEAELAQLNRDYDVVRKNYEQLVARRESASLGEKINETTNTGEFRVVEPPRVSPSPAKPSRSLVAMLTLFASLAAGLGVTFGLTQLMPSIVDIHQLKLVTGRPVLGSVSLVLDGELVEKMKRQNLLFFSTMGVFLVLNLGWIVVVKKFLSQ